LTKLAEYLTVHRRVPVSTETIRRVLRGAGISWQATKTWKASKDPDFAARMARVLTLYDSPPVGGRVICVDEFGPLSLQPRPGRGWFPRSHAARRRATYTRKAGVRQTFAALDLASGQLFLPVPRPETLDRVPRVLPPTTTAFPDRAALPDLRQLRPPPQGRGLVLVRWSQHRTGVHPDQRLVAELDRATRGRMRIVVFVEGGSADVEDVMPGPVRKDRPRLQGVGKVVG
jgi:hypothetical protein